MPLEQRYLIRPSRSERVRLFAAFDTPLTEERMDLELALAAAQRGELDSDAGLRRCTRSWPTRVWYLPKAVRQLDAILSYLAARNPSAVRRVGDAVNRSIERIARFPHGSR